MTEIQFAAQARADALKAGQSPAAAEALYRHYAGLTGAARKRGLARAGQAAFDSGPHRSPQPRASAARSNATIADKLAALARSIYRNADPRA